MDDARWMRAALSLARRGLGTVAPNPAVGCIILDAQGRLAGRGWTQRGGRPHAETEALRRVGSRARGGTAYVTLEPCSHHGQTPPCASALIEAGVTRVVAACGDPDPRVSGRGFEMLRAAGIEVVTGVCEADAEEANAGFFSKIRRGRPLVTLKLASTLDGRIATKSGESQWITGEPARRAGHMLRATHDGIVVGLNTLLADDPTLTCRLPGLEDRSPVRIVADSHLRTPLTSKLAATAREIPTWIVVAAGVEAERRKAFEALGCQVIEIAPDAESRPLLLPMLEALAERGLTTLLAEGGAALAAALLREDLVDRAVWFHAPSLMGGDGKPAVQPYGVERLADMRRYRRADVRQVGDDLVETYVRAH
ncbi:MAG TPA: bifunctional diaminohydroxyphosphoribosylaminopyrimidine deaminase/5-amino-6-(5-phosphoribosylamino)uracil reductase RibD [Alphaproteobacteria bacterium]|jgi:diaminohydroxyphosphoribosylaminopyrimidine deaminase/5-amino-6-(5-phosphoribosylamino)uracil reductase